MREREQLYFYFWRVKSFNSTKLCWITILVDLKKQDNPSTNYNSIVIKLYLGHRSPYTFKQATNSASMWPAIEEILFLTILFNS